MHTDTLSPQALSVIDQYLHFRLGAAVCSVPYFNNKTVRARAAPAARVGKGSPREILDEIQAIVIKNHIAADTLADESLKKLLTDDDLGIDCSGFARHILDEESAARGKGGLSRHLHLIRARGLVGKLLSSMNPAKATDVATFADDQNSKVTPIAEIAPGDMITMMTNPPVTGSTDAERNHILIVHQTERPEQISAEHPLIIHYSHAVAYPEDGIYGTGIKQGAIVIADASKPITEGRWMENGKEGLTENGAAAILARAKRSRTEIRRLSWF